MAILRKRELDLPESTLYDWIQDGTYIEGFKLGPRCVGWFDYEVEALVRARAASVPKAGLQAIVRELRGLRDDALRLDEAGIVEMVRRHKGLVAA